MTASLGEGGPFRGLVPFQESDQQQFFGRDTERARLQQWLRHDKPAAALITGGLASGKTSLIQAVLIPLAKAARMLPLYVDVGEGWEGQLRAGLARQLGRQIGPADDTAAACLQLSRERQTPTLLILDHLEQLVWFDESALATFNRLLGGLSAELGRSVRLVLGLERGDLHVLSRISEPERRIPEQARLHVGRLDQRQTAHLIERTILVGGAYMEAGLPDLIAEELCASGPVLPAQIQIVCHAAVLARRLTVSSFKRVGGASVLSSLYVEQLAARAGGWRAKRVLAMLSEPDNPRAEFSVEQIASGCGLPTPFAESVSESLVNAGLARRVTHQAATANRYGILHPYLLPQVRDLIAPLRRGRARARRALQRRVDRPGLLRPQDLFSIWRYLGNALSPKEALVVKRSWRAWTLAGGLALSLLLVSCVAIWARLASSSYLAPASGVPAPQRLVLRRGDPSLRFAFGWGVRPYGDVALDTGFAMSSLPTPLLRSVEQGRIKGDLVERAHGIPRWLNEILLPLPPARRGALLVLAGRMQSGSTLLADAANQPAERERAVRALVLLTGNSEATRRALLACMDDPRAPVRRMAVTEAARLGAEVALPVLGRAVRDQDPQVRLAALRALASLPRPQALPLVGKLVRDSDARVRQRAIEQIRAAAAEHPLTVFDITLAVAASADGGTKLSRSLAIELQRLQHEVAQRVPAQLAKHLVARLPAESEPSRRAALLGALVPLTEHVTRAVLPIVQPLLEDADVDVRATATGLHARFAEPEQAMEQLASLAKTFRPRTEATAMRKAAAQGLAWVRAPDDKERIDLLERLLADSERPVRDAAVASLLHLGARGLKEVVSRIKRGYIDAAEAALTVLCSDPKPDRRLATTLLMATWDLKRSDLRRQALACAASLDAANPWLSAWLADRAALDKDSLVRRAAARAVALALTHSGNKIARLPRFYLRDKDPTVRVAVLRQIARNPPRPADFLLPMIERAAGAAEPPVRAAAAAAVLPVAPSAIDAAVLLEPLVRDEDDSVRAAALEGLSRLESPQPGQRSARWEEARQRLDQSLSADVSTLPLSAVRTALAVATKLELTTTLTRAAGHAHPQARAEAIEHLAAHAAPPVALKVLAAARRDPALAPRLAAVKGLAAQSARLGQAVVPLLAGGTEAAEVSERWATFEALGDLQGEASSQALELLREAARDRSERRRQMAMRALGRLSTHVAAAATVLIEGTLDPAHDVRTEAMTALAMYMGRACPPDALWQLLIDGERNALLRHLATTALAWHSRLHGTAWLKGRVHKLDQTLPVVTEMAARLALALARDQKPPQETLSWLLG